MSKGYWHYIPVIHGDGQSQAVTIHEAHFNGEGQLLYWTKRPASGIGDTVEELRDSLRMQLDDAGRYLPQHINKLKVGMTIPRSPE